MDSNPVIDKLFSVGAHYAYAPSRRHPSTAPFIFGVKGGVELFDLEQTAECLSRAQAFIQTLAAERKTILFVGSKAEARTVVRRGAEKIGAPYVTSRWIGGTLTNFSEIKKRLSRLGELSEMREKGELARFTKRERLLIDREITELENMFGGLRGMQKIPDVLFVIDPKQEHIAVEEAMKMHLPIIALMNSDCNAAHINYPIPANDASVQSLSYIVEELVKTYAEHLGALPQPQESEIQK